MFTSDVEGLLNLLGGSKQSGMLRLEPETRAWQVCFILVQGKPIDCVVTSPITPAIKVEPEEAIEELCKQGALQWELLPLSPPSPAGGEGSVSSSAGNRMDVTCTWLPRDCPYKMKDEPPPPTWDRLQRKIFLLIDGKRMIQDIAFLLNKQTEELQLPLQTLYQEGWIGKAT